MEIKKLGYKEQLVNINYTFDHEKIYGLIGNQSNITLLLEIIAGLVKPTKGEIKDLKKVFMFFSNTTDQLFADTVKENITYGLEDVNLKAILEELDLEEDICDKNVLCLSESEKRKVAFASMLAYNPDIIVIDNFFNQIDFKTQKKLLDILKKLQKDENKIIIMSDQNTDLLYEFVDEMIVLTNEILLSGKKANVFANEEVLADLEIELPSYVEFSNYVALNKGVKIPYRDCVTDIVKDVYDNVQ